MLAVIALLGTVAVLLHSAALSDTDGDCQNCAYGDCSRAVNGSYGQFCGNWFDSDYAIRWCCCAFDSTCSSSRFSCQCIDPATPTPTDSFRATQAGMITAVKVGVGIGGSVAFIVSVCTCYIMFKVRKKWKILKGQLGGRVAASAGAPTMQSGVVWYTVPFQGTAVPVEVANTSGNNVVPMYAHPGVPVGYANPGIPAGFAYGEYYPGNPAVTVRPEGFQPGLAPLGGFPPGVAAAGGIGYPTGVYTSNGIGFNPALGGYNGGAHAGGVYTYGNGY